MAPNSAWENKLLNLLVENLFRAPLSSRGVTDYWEGVQRPYPKKIKHLADACHDQGVRFYTEQTPGGPRNLYAFVPPSALPYVKLIESELIFYKSICDAFQGRITMMEQRMEELEDETKPD